MLCQDFCIWVLQPGVLYAIIAFVEDPSKCLIVRHTRSRVGARSETGWNIEGLDLQGASSFCCRGMSRARLSTERRDTRGDPVPLLRRCVTQCKCSIRKVWSRKNPAPIISLLNQPTSCNSTSRLSCARSLGGGSDRARGAIGVSRLSQTSLIRFGENCVS